MKPSPSSALRRALATLRCILPSGRALAIGIPFAALLLLFVVPFLLVLKISLAQSRMGIPPYTPLFTLHAGVLDMRLQIHHYVHLLRDDIYLKTYWASLRIAGLTTVLCLLLGYPLAYAIARSAPAWRRILLLGVMLPFWTSFLIRVYAWIGILRDDGFLNRVLLALHVIAQPLHLYHTTTGVYIGMVYSYLPFMIMPLYAHLEKMDLSLLEAAYDLGARPWDAFVRITLPLSLGGIVAGCLLVFIPAVGEYVIPELLGGASTLMLGRVMWDQFFNNMDWPMAAAVTVAMVGVLLVPLALFLYTQVRELEARP